MLVDIEQKYHDQIIEILPDERVLRDMFFKHAGIIFCVEGLKVSASPIGWTKRRKLTEKSNRFIFFKQTTGPYSG
jgi:hypothetical protein